MHKPLEVRLFQLTLGISHGDLRLWAWYLCFFYSRERGNDAICEIFSFWPYDEINQMETLMALRGVAVKWVEKDLHFPELSLGRFSVIFE